VYLVIAHEWGHAIQDRLDLSLHSLSAELQADCLAGAAIIGAVDDGNLLLEPGDRGEIFQSLAEVADEVEWGDSQDHGSADERIEAYQLGESDGVFGCLPEG
jgi:predicted metalloprotease